MRLKIEHRTEYVYSQPSSYALLQLRMRPRSDATQTVESWTLNLEGARHHARFIDHLGTDIDLIEPLPGSNRVAITLVGEVETRTPDRIVAPGKSLLDPSFFLRDTGLTKPTDTITALGKWTGETDVVEVGDLHRLSQTILDAMPYTTGTTDVSTSAADAFERKTGVCQDHTHVFLSAARAMGVPARYVSGYLMMDDRVEQDASHAWAEAYVAGLGWIGFDISNGISPDERYVKIAHGLDYKDCTPTHGIVIGVATTADLIVSIQVQQ
ncbi:MAG: transglutaminase family protein [Litorimonas sp.]